MAITESTNDAPVETDMSDAHRQGEPAQMRRVDLSRLSAATAVGLVFGALAIMVILALVIAAPWILGDRIEFVDDADPTDVVSVAEAPTEPAEAVEPVSTPPVVAPASSGTDSGMPMESCSAVGMDIPRAQPELPPAVADTRSAIIAAALECDYAALGALLSVDFVASTEATGAIELWREQEANDLDPMAKLVGLLSLPHGTITTDDGPESAAGQVTTIVWPTAALHDPFDSAPTADREALLDLYSNDEIESFSEFGYYVGYRLGIDDSGAWLWFLAGD